MRCTLCGNEGTKNFFNDEVYLKKLGPSEIKMIVMTCNHCGDVEMFNASRFNINFDE